MITFFFLLFKIIIAFNPKSYNTAGAEIITDLQYYPYRDKRLPRDVTLFSQILRLSLNLKIIFLQDKARTLVLIKYNKKKGNQAKCVSVGVETNGNKDRKQSNKA